MSAAVQLLPGASPATPFKFLSYYEEADAPSFAGREREILEIANAILSAPTLIIYGKSGLGKTSLILAGVFPELRRRNCLPVHVRTLQNPIGDLCREIQKHVGGRRPEQAASFDLSSLVENLRELSDSATVVLVLDQFEEFFIRFRGQRETYDAFVEAIGVITRERDLRVRIVFSLREEYLADLDDFRANVPSLFENEYRLRQLTAFGVRETITRPLDIARLAYDPRLISRLVNRLSRERFDSVMLQIACQEVFDHAMRRAPHDLRLTEADLHDADDIDAIFRRYLDETTKALPPERHLQARVVLRCLTTQERTKQALRLSDFARAMYRLEEHEIVSVLTVLEQHRLLRVDLRGNERWYELTHERLVPILEEWLRLDPQFNALLAAHDLIVTPTRSGVFRSQPQNLLPAGFLSDVVGPFRERLALGEREHEFLLWSAMYHRHPDVAFWAAAYGKEESRKLVLEKLHASDAVFRRGAAFAAARLSIGHEPALQRLLAVSLTDSDPDVRREAGAALAKIGGRSETTSLKAALENSVTRKVALETLADRCAQKCDMREFSRWDRFLAHRIARARLLREQRLLIADAARDGAIGGFYGALGWTLSAALVYSVLLSFVVAARESGPKLALFAMFLGAALLGAVLFGGILTTFVSRSVATRMVLTGRANVAHLLWTSIAYLLVPGVWMLFWLGALLLAAWTGELRGGPDPLEFAFLAGMPVIYWLLVPVFIRLAQLAARPTDSVASLSAVVLFASAGLPLFIPALGIFAGFALDERTFGPSEAGEFLRIVSAFAVPFSSGLTACLGGGVIRMCRNHGAELAPDNTALGARSSSQMANGLRWALPAAAIGVFVSVMGTLGPGAIPFRPSFGSLSAKSPHLELPIDGDGTKSLVPRVRYHRFDVDGPESAHLPVRVKNSEGAVLDGVRIWDEPLVLLRSGGHELRTDLRAPGATFILDYVPLDQAMVQNGERVEKLRWQAWGKGSILGRYGQQFTEHEMTLTGKSPPGSAVRVQLLPALRREDQLTIGRLRAWASCGRGSKTVSMNLVTSRQAIQVLSESLECLGTADEHGDWRVTYVLTFENAHEDGAFSSLVVLPKTP